MSHYNILSTFPDELLDHIFRLLSSHRATIRACRLTCRKFYTLSSPYLITYVVLPAKFEAVRKLHEISLHPYFALHVRELIYVESQDDDDDEYRYQRALGVTGWEEFNREEKELWQIMGRYFTGRFGGPEILEHIGTRAQDGLYHRIFADYSDYIGEIQITLLEKLPMCLPRLQSVLLIDYQTAITARFLNSDQSTPRRFWDYESSYLAQSRNLGLLMAIFDRHDLKSLSVGSFFDLRRNSTEYLPTIWPGGRSSPSLDVEAFDSEWELLSENFTNVMQGLRNLQLSFVVHNQPLRKSILPRLVQLAAPNLVILGVDTIGLSQQTSPPDADMDDWGLDFTSSFSELLVPHLKRLELRGWRYTQAQMQCFLRRHANTLRELVLVENVLLQKNEVPLDEFLGSELSLSELEIFDSSVVHSSCDSSLH